jgi:hypothetical protein
LVRKKFVKAKKNGFLMEAAEPQNICSEIHRIDFRKVRRTETSTSYGALHLSQICLQTLLQIFRCAAPIFSIIKPLFIKELEAN